MIEIVLCITVGVFVIALLVCFTAWLRFLDDESKVRHDLKHRCHHHSDRKESNHGQS